MVMPLLEVNVYVGEMLRFIGMVVRGNGDPAYSVELMTTLKVVLFRYCSEAGNGIGLFPQYPHCSLFGSMLSMLGKATRSSGVHRFVCLSIPLVRPSHRNSHSMTFLKFAMALNSHSLSLHLVTSDDFPSFLFLAKNQFFLCEAW